MDGHFRPTMMTDTTTLPLPFDPSLGVFPDLRWSEELEVQLEAEGASMLQLGPIHSNLPPLPPELDVDGLYGGLLQGLCTPRDEPQAAASGGFTATVRPAVVHARRKTGPRVKPLPEVCCGLAVADVLAVPPGVWTEFVKEHNVPPEAAKELVKLRRKTSSVKQSKKSRDKKKVQDEKREREIETLRARLACAEGQLQMYRLVFGPLEAPIQLTA